MVNTYQVWIKKPGKQAYSQFLKGQSEEAVERKVRHEQCADNDQVIVILSNPREIDSQERWQFNISEYEAHSQRCAVSTNPANEKICDASWERAPTLAATPLLLTAALALVRICKDAAWRGKESLELSDLEDAVAPAKEAITSIEHPGHNRCPYPLFGK